jgi:hypothetical protein
MIASGKSGATFFIRERGKRATFHNASARGQVAT